MPMAAGAAVQESLGSSLPEASHAPTPTAGPARDENVRNTFIDYALPKCTPDGDAIHQVPRVWKTEPLQLSWPSIATSAESGVAAPKVWGTEMIMVPTAPFAQEAGPISPTARSLSPSSGEPEPEEPEMPVWKTDEVHFCDLLAALPGGDGYPAPPPCLDGPLPPPGAQFHLPQPQNLLPSLPPPPFQGEPTAMASLSGTQRDLAQRQREIEAEMQQIEMQKLELRQQALRQQLWALEMQKRDIMAEQPQLLPQQPHQPQQPQRPQQPQQPTFPLVGSSATAGPPPPPAAAAAAAAAAAVQQKPSAGPAVRPPLPLIRWTPPAADEQRAPLTNAADRLNLETQLAELAVPNVGSLEHNGPNGCSPCAFLHKDPRGCLHGVTCKFCHLCPPGELKRRKQEKITRMKADAAAAEEQAAARSSAALADPPIGPESI